MISNSKNYYKDFENLAPIFFEVSNDLFIIIKLDDEFTIEFINNCSLMEKLGYSNDSLMGSSILDLVHIEDKKKLVNLLVNNLKDIKRSEEMRIETSAHETVWVEVTLKKFRSELTTSKGLLNLKDISKQKNLEKKLSINENKISEQRLIESEEKYRELAELLPDIIFETDHALNLTYVNSAAFQKFDYTLEEVKSGLSVSSFIHPSYKEKALLQIKSIFEGKETKPNDYLLCKKDGSCFYARIHSRPIFKDGHVIGIGGTITDINEMMLSEQDLRESEEKFRTIADQSFMGILIIQDGIFKYYNDQALNLNGYTEEEVKKWKPYEFSKLIHPDDKDFVMEQAKKKEDGELDVVQHHKYRIITKSGQICWVENFSKTINYKGRSADFVMTIDVTDKIHAEKKLKESEEKYRLITENSQDIVYTLDMKLNNTYISPSVYNVLGYNVDEALSMHPKDNTHKDDLLKIGKIFREVFKNEREKENTRNLNRKKVFTVREWHKDGRLLTMEHTISWLRDEKGIGIGILGIARDVTLKTKTEALLKESEEKYRSLFENMNAGFAYNEVIVDEANKPIDYKFLEVNSKFEELTGFKKELTINRKITEAIPGNINDPADWIGRFGKVGITGVPLATEVYSVTIDKWFKVSAYSPKKGYFAATFTDITNHKKIEEKLKASEKRYRQLFENSPIALMEQDYSELKRYVEDLKASGFNDFEKLFEDSNEVLKCMNKTRVIDVNRKTLEIYQSENKEKLAQRINQQSDTNDIKMSEEIFQDNKREMLALINGETSYESEIITNDELGNAIYLFAKTSLVPGYENTWSKVIVSLLDITGRKLTEQKLKDSEEKYHHLFETSPDGVVLADSEGNILECNTAIEKITGYSIEEFIGKNMMRLQMHENSTSELIAEGNKELFDMNKIEYVEFPFIRKDGEIRWVQIIGSLINLKGKAHILSVFHDITIIKNAEEALKKSREQYRDLLETSSIGILEINIDTNKIKYINPKLLEIIGYSREELNDLTIRNKIIHPKDLPKLMETNEEMELEFRIIDKNGKLKWVSGKRIPNFDEYDNLISSRLWLDDITEKKMYEELIYELNVNFLNFTANIQNNIQLLLNTGLKLLNGDLILYAHKVKSDDQDLYYIITSDNDSYTFDSQEFSEKLLISKFFNEGHDFPQTFNNINQETYFNSDPFIQKIQAKGCFGKVIRSQEGLDNIVCVFYKNNPIINGQDKLVLFLICDAIEIEQRRWQVQQDLEEQNTTLNKINKLKTELLSRTSHELKTPLISIKGFTELLLTLHKSKLDPETISILDEIKEGSKRLEKIINLLLESAKLEAGQLELKKAKEDLTFLINFCVKELKGLATLRNQSILFDPNKKVEIMFDKERIYEVISNLLLNAVKYTPPGGRISIQTSINGNECIVSIKDNGIGFTEEEKKQVFKQFGKIERYGQGWDVAIEGTGLGLYITKKLVELHGGKIWLTSEGRNKGTTFNFSIPVEE
jgi:PAS domain S-box-containing protein